MSSETAASLAIQVRSTSRALGPRRYRRISADAVALVIGLVAMSSDLVLPLGVAGVLVCACALGLACVSMGTRLSDRPQRERVRDACLSDPGADLKRLELCERRLRCLDDCEAMASRFADELAIVADTVRLIAQRVACPDDLPADDTIDRQLAELDERDAAHHQLAIELQGGTRDLLDRPS